MLRQLPMHCASSETRTGSASLRRPNRTPDMVCATAKPGTILRKGFPPSSTSAATAPVLGWPSGNCQVDQLKPGDVDERHRQIILISEAIIISATCDSGIITAPSDPESATCLPAVAPRPPRFVFEAGQQINQCFASLRWARMRTA